MPLLYNLGLGLYRAGIQVAQPISAKARAWVQGRRGSWQRLEAKRERLNGCLWMHCASVGEFEQGLPVLEAIKRERPGMPVLITFFSPSGYAARKHFPLADHVEYLPLDSAANAKRFIDIVRPAAVLWVRYEFWYHWLHALRERGVATYLISGIFRDDQPFFKWYGRSHCAMLRCFTRLFVQDEGSRERLAALGIGNVQVCGDTRFDRVDAIARSGGAFPIGQAFHRAMDAPVLIAGSTWPADERLLNDAFSGMPQPPRVIVVPHEPLPSALNKVEGSFPQPTIRWSELERRLAESPTRDAQVPPDEDPFFARTLLVDRMGLLARLYQHADVAYVGGGFTGGIHSILEAAAWGRPVIFGPRHRKFIEARALIEAGGGFEVRDAAELRSLLSRLLHDRSVREAAAVAALGYVREQVGATARMAAAIIADLR
jgi:3-deoxy-D-manno-octulosonic-acid transferase